jgi:hypothetical protein
MHIGLSVVLKQQLAIHCITNKYPLLFEEKGAVVQVKTIYLLNNRHLVDQIFCTCIDIHYP